MRLLCLLTESFQTRTDNKLQPMKVLIVYHTVYGHTLLLARAIEEGVKSVSGVEAVFRRAPEFPHVEKELESALAELDNAEQTLMGALS